MVNKISSTKTEKRAISVLRSIIDSHSSMDYSFNEDDTEKFWDGYIWLNKLSDGDQSKENFESRISVQIKGHNDPTQRYINMDRISYPVDLLDLRAYSTEKGVIYFQIFINDLTSRIFYALLFPSKIADYLEEADRRGNKVSINIQFSRLSDNSEELFYIVKQFSKESTFQGSGHNPLVQDRIRVEDFSKIKCLQLNVVGTADPLEALKRLASGDVCIYGKTSDDKYFRPIEWKDSTKYSFEHEVNRKISIDEELFYDKYVYFADSDGNIVLQPSPNLELQITDNKIHFKPVSNLNKIYVDLMFMRRLKSTKKYYIDDQKIDCSISSFPQELDQDIELFIVLYESVKEIQIEINSDFTDLSDLQLKQLYELVKIKRSGSRTEVKEGTYKHLWTFDDKYVPLVIKKEGESIKLINSVYSNEFAVYAHYEEGLKNVRARIPLFCAHDAEVLSNLYEYRFDIFKNQIDKSDINVYSFSNLMLGVLLLINVYDRIQNPNFLDLAEYLLQKLKLVSDHTNDKETILLNMLQIKKRRGDFSAIDAKALEELKVLNPYSQFGKYVLLADRNKAVECFSQFSQEEQNEFRKYPIFKFYKELTCKQN